MKEHQYSMKIEWIAEDGLGTVNYSSYSRNHSIKGIEKYDVLLASSDPAFRGDTARYNPEELFLSSIASCHMLWYLHLCSANGIVVTHYSDSATGIMEEDAHGSGKFKSVTLHPNVTITDNSKSELAIDLHVEANKMCFIANSCNFKVHHLPEIRIQKKEE